MEEKNFLGLDGLSHFWTKAKTWIIDRITTEVTAKIAEVVAKAPEDLDTLKEIADWIKTHANDASAMNTQINTNKNDIAALQTSVAGKAAASHTHDDRYFTETEVTNKLAGKSDTGHTHTKSQITDFPTSLPANGGTATKATQDGSGNVITSTYVKKSGDTLTGPIVMKGNQYTLETAQLDMKNSDIKGANAIWFDDHAEVGEGLKFPRSSGSNYDFMRLDDGKIKVASNVTGNASTATESIVAYTSDIPTSLPANGGTATKATQDGSGNVITSTYVKKSGDTLTGQLTTAKGTSQTALNGIKLADNSVLTGLANNVLLLNNNALRFSDVSDWDYNKWAGLKYVSSTKQIDLGIADNSDFTANNAQTGGTLKLSNITKLRLNSGSVDLTWNSTTKSLDFTFA